MKKLKLHFPKEIIIGDNTFKIIQDKKTTGGSFIYWKEEKGKPKQGNITIGTFRLKENPTQVLTIIIHELKEIIQMEQSVRYQRPDENENYEFHYSHKEHADLCTRLAQALSQFL